MYEGMDQNIEYNDLVIDVDDKNISFDNVQVTIPQYSEEGIWTLRLIDARDAVGNSLYLYSAIDENGNPIKGKYQNGLGELIDLDFKTEFEVISSNPDTTAPEIKKLELSKDKFDVSQGDATFNLSVNLTDDLSGFINSSEINRSNISLTWNSPSGRQYVNAFMFEGMDQYIDYNDVVINVDGKDISFDNVGNHSSIFRRRNMDSRLY